jgi:large subunit ribosomal protein L28
MRVPFGDAFLFMHHTEVRAVSKVCEKCGKKPVAGRSYARRGLAKKKGGVGKKITGITKRRFHPNVQNVRVKERNGTVHRVKLCTKCLRVGLRDGTISKAPRKPRPPKVAPEPVFEVATGSLAPPDALEGDAAAVAEERAKGVEGERRRPADISERAMEEMEAAYEEEKDSEAEKRMEGLRDEKPESPGE